MAGSETIRDTTPSHPLDTSWTTFDSFVGGFQPSRLTLIDSESPEFIYMLASMLCVRAVESWGDVVYVDGGNSIDLYAIAEFSKRRGLSIRRVLSRIHVSRAFTAYQLSAIINEKLEEAIRCYTPSLVLISCISDLFLDGALRKMEAESMLERSMSTIKSLTSGLITVVTNKAGHGSRSDALRDVLRNEADETIDVTVTKQALRVHRGGKFIDLCYVPPNQMTLDEFGGGNG